MRIQTILHATDFSECSEHALKAAAALAHDYGARLVICHVMPAGTTELVALARLGSVTETSNIHESFLDDLRKIHPPDLTVPVEHRLEDGDPTLAIVRVAAEIHADLVVIGTHGRTGLGRLLMGSVAEEVVRKAPCPVLTVRLPMPESVPVSVAATAASQSPIASTANAQAVALERRPTTAMGAPIFAGGHRESTEKTMSG